MWRQPWNRGDSQVPLQLCSVMAPRLHWASVLNASLLPCWSRLLSCLDIISFYLFRVSPTLLFCSTSLLLFSRGVCILLPCFINTAASTQVAAAACVSLIVFLAAFTPFYSGYRWSIHPYQNMHHMSSSLSCVSPPFCFSVALCLY